MNIEAKSNTQEKEKFINSRSGRIYKERVKIVEHKT